MSNPPLLIVGLGNPENEYGETRHNFGFMVITGLLEKYQGVFVSNKNKFEANLWDTKIDGKKTILMQPMTYMNESGRAVKKIVSYLKIPLDNIIVVHDDLDLPLGTIRVSQGASAGGHNGVQSVIDALGTKDFARVRMGIGRPTNDQPAENYVLARFTPEEKGVLPGIIAKSILEIEKIFSK
jgi:PTH1 family peptidyl-tRNA hydrolase